MENVNDDVIQLLTDITNRTEEIMNNKEGSQTGSSKDCAMLGLILERIYLDLYFGKNWEDEDVIQVYSEQMNFIFPFLESVKLKFQQDGILWSVCVLIKFVTSSLPNSLVDQTYQRIARQLKLMDVDCRDKLFKQIISEWTNVSSNCATVICFNPEQSLKFVDETNPTYNYCLKPILFDLSQDLDGDVKYSMLNCLLNMILFNGCDFSRLSEMDVVNLWGCLISDANDERIAARSISVMHKLLTSNLYASIHLINFLDILFSFIQYFEYNPDVNADFRYKLERQINFILVDIGKIIAKLSINENLHFMSFESLKPFIMDAIDLVIVSKGLLEGLIGFINGFLKFINEYCSTEEISNNLDDFAEKCVGTVKRIVLGIDSDSPMLEFVAHLFIFIKKTKGSAFVKEIIKEIANVCESDVALKIQVRQVLIFAFSSTETLMEFLELVLPSEADFVNVSNMLDQGVVDEATLNLLFDASSIVSKSSTVDPDVLMTFLSLPWICEIDWTDLEKFQKSLAPLVMIKKKELIVKSVVCSINLKSKSIKGLAMFPQKNEWRSIIFKKALESDDSVLLTSTLDALPYIVHTMQDCPFMEWISALLNKFCDAEMNSNAISIVSALFKALKSCICVAAKKYDVENLEIVCRICQAGDSATAVFRLDIPDSLLRLSEMIIRWEGVDELKMEFIRMLSSILKHVAGLEIQKERLISISFRLLPLSGGIGCSYRDYILQEIVKLDLSSSITEELAKNLYSLADDVERLYYYACVAQFSSNEKMGLNYLLALVHSAAVREEKSSLAIRIARTTISSIAANQDIQPNVFFMRNSAVICFWSVKRLYERFAVIAQESENEFTEDQIKLKQQNVVDIFFDSMGLIFCLSKPSESVKAFVDYSLQHLAPFVVLHRHSKYSDMVLDKICQLRSCDKQALVIHVMPNIFWLVIGFRKNKLEDSFFPRLYRFCGDVESTIRFKPFKFISNIVLAQGPNDEISLDYAKKIYEIIRKDSWPLEFDYGILLNNYHLPILLELRKALTDDYFYHYRRTIVYSFCTFIKNITVVDLSQMSTKIMDFLKLATPPDVAVEAWSVFISTLDTETLHELLPQILLGVAPLYKIQCVSELLNSIFETRRRNSSDNPSCQRFDRAAFVLHTDETPFLNFLPAAQLKPDNILTSCANMLMEEGPDVQALVLPKIIQTLENDAAAIDKIGELVPALLYALKTSISEEVNLMIGTCFGKIGAIDPGRIGMTAVGDNSKHTDRRNYTEVKGPDNIQDFFEFTLVTCAKLLMDCTDSEKADFIGYSIQQVFRELNSVDLQLCQTKVMKSLKPEVLKEIEPYKKSSFTAEPEKPNFTNKPFVKYAKSYSDWLWQWYFSASNNIRDLRLSRIFKSLQPIYESGDIRLPLQMLPQMVVQSLLEINSVVRDEALQEIHAVFEYALENGCGWIHFAAHTCFQILEFVEKFSIQRMKSVSNSNLPNVLDFLKNAIGRKCENTNMLLSVAVAEKYNSSCRALRWLEQYGIHVDKCGTLHFDRDAVYCLERIYNQLGDTDGVLGAFATIKSNKTIPSAREQIVAFEATGDYTAALPLYQKSPVQKVPLVKCLLRLNQPCLAFTTATSLKKDEQGYTLQKLTDYEIEAAYKIEEWEFLKKTLKDKTDDFVINSWGANVAVIFSKIHEQTVDEFETSIQRARKQLTESLQALTMDDVDTYSKAYRYIQRLHILYEIEDGAANLKLLPGLKLTKKLGSLLEKWKIRSENAIQCSTILEPIYSVRRDLLKMSDPIKNNENICYYFLESCKLARQAGHLSTAWTHLINARSLNVQNDLQIDVEESRYLFQKGEQSNAIETLKKSLEKHFPDLMKAMETEVRRPEQLQEAYLNAKNVRRTYIVGEKRQDFAEAGLVLADFIDKASAANVTEVFRIFKFIFELDQSKLSEHLVYKFAVFYDRCYYLRNPSVKQSVLFMLDLYNKLLSLGQRYVLHIMPRMLTIWFDFTSIPENLEQERKNITDKGRKRSANKEDCNNKIINDKMLFIFNAADKYCFYTAFPQLVSHICHKSDLTFKLLESMIVELMIIYPHQCLWQIIASYRSEDGLRNKRTCKIIEVLCANHQSRYNFKTLISQYAFIATELIRVAECTKNKAGITRDFNKNFPQFSLFFKNNVSRIAVPFISMVEKQMPTFQESQITIPQVQDDTIYITGFEDEYQTFNSLEKPKRITMIGSNGVRYSLIAKKNDELRKDSRCLDFCRTVNTLLLRDPEARRRQLHIRTYSVIPLQAKGGIIEWVPNLGHFRKLVTSSKDPTPKMTLWTAAKTSADGRRKFFNDLCEKTPVQMAEYLRNNFPDPSKWYGARLAFTRTAATMSMVGFILGLGDRHGENILIDETNGEICHVDFNVLFNKGEDLPCPEKVPFRLTRNFIDGFGPTGVEGCFRKSCEVVMKLLREEQEMLCTVLQTFVHDPLLEFNKIEHRNQQMRQLKDKQHNAFEQGKSCEEINLIRARLEGNIVTKKFHQASKSTIPMSVEGQVAELIRMATDPEILAEMYIGWNPHL